MLQLLPQSPKVKKNLGVFQDMKSKRIRFDSKDVFKYHTRIESVADEKRSMVLIGMECDVGLLRLVRLFDVGKTRMYRDVLG